MPVTINGSDGITNASWTTGTRPSNPVAGQIGYNTDLGFTEVYDGNNDEWQPLNPFSQQVVAAVSEATDINEAASFVGLGAIVEIDSNSNGNYVRWENGVQLSWNTQVDVDFSSSTEQFSTSWPAEFIESPGGGYRAPGTNLDGLAQALGSVSVLHGADIARLQVGFSFDRSRTLTCHGWGFWK